MTNGEVQQPIGSQNPASCNHLLGMSELLRVPEFLNAIGKGVDGVAFTAYGGDGGNWHYAKNEDGSAKEVAVTGELLGKLAEHGARAREQKEHQLGFYPGRGGSKLKQLTTVPCLKAESDQCDIQDQIRVYQEFEHIYGVKMTLVRTGGKSIHAYLRITEEIEASKYHVTCRAFNELLQEVGDSLEISYIPDQAMYNPAQAMRLPGAIHKKTGKIAEVIQLGEPCSLADIELEEAAIQERSQANLERETIAMFCQASTLGYEGDEERELLLSIAKAWEKRVPGQNTYTKVLPLIGGLTGLMGPEQAAKLLHSAGHCDRNGSHSLEGLLSWCESFRPRGEDPSSIRSRLIQQAESRYGWQRPEIKGNSLILKSTEQTTSEFEISLNAREHGGGTYIHRTGSGKTVQILSVIREWIDEAQIKAFAESRTSKLSALVLTPRATLNGQNAKLVCGVDVSSSQSPASQLALDNIYVCCPNSLGKPSKQKGDPALWGEFQSPGDVPGGSKPIKTGAGMPAPAFAVIDEFRQLMEMILLSDAEHDGTGLWKTPKEHLEVIKNTFSTIRNAIHVYSLDAQMGATDQQLLKSLRPDRNDWSRVVGQAPAKHGAIFEWTESKATWKEALRRELVRKDRSKPILCIVASKGNPGILTTKGMSAWSLKNLIETIPLEDSNGQPLKAIVIDSQTKDYEEQRAVLENQEFVCDIVIATPVAQSGFSWIGKFHEVGFVAGGSTLSPNICGGQAGRRERTLKRCIAYVPKKAIITNNPFTGLSHSAIKAQIIEAHIENNIQVDKHELIINAQADYAHRQIVECMAYREFTLKYAEADGWEVVSLPDIHPHRSGKKRELKSPNKADITESEWATLSLPQQQLLMAMANKLSIEQLSANQKKWMEGGAGIDLVKSNLAKVASILVDSRLYELCDGVGRTHDDPLIIYCSEVLNTKESIKAINACGPLKVTLGRGKGKADEADADTNKPNIKLIGTIVRALGGRARHTSGDQGAKARWILPREESPKT